MANTVRLQPISMIRPTRENIYTPLRKIKEIGQVEFLANYADHACTIQVSFEEDGISNPHSITAYGFGLDCWYIVLEYKEDE